MRIVSLRAIRFVNVPQFIIMGILQGLNKDVLARITKELGIQTMKDKLPLDLVSTIQPVLISNPENTVNIVKNSATSATLYTTPTDQDFYLTSLHITVISQKADDLEQGNIALSPEISGVETFYCRVGSNLTEVGNNALILHFDTHPIKLKRGSTVVLGGTAGSISGGITGYTVDSI